MASLLIIIRECENAREVVDGIAVAVCPYLGTFGELASITATERVRAIEGGELGCQMTLLRILLAGSARVSFATLVSKLERFLRQAAKDAEMAIKFELLQVQLAESEAASK